jgi:hypothetical protein
MANQWQMTQHSERHAPHPAIELNSEQDHLFEGAALDPSPSEFSPQHTNGESV